MASKNPHHEGNPSLEFEDDQKRKIIAPKDLSIVWGEDKRYWNVPKDEESSPAELYQVCWLEVTGCIDKMSWDKEYEVGFDVSLSADAFGWGGSPIYVMFKRGKGGKFQGKKFALDNNKPPPEIKLKLPKLDKPVDDSKVYFGLYEVWSGKWKGGLKLHHAFVQELPASGEKIE